MKKFFNDHVGLCFAAAVIVAGVALYFALKNKKDISQLTTGLAALVPGTTPEPAAE